MCVLQIAENSAEGAVVGSLSVDDEDADQTHTCEVINIQQVPFKVSGIFTYSDITKIESLRYCRLKIGYFSFKKALYNIKLKKLLASHKMHYI